MAYEVHVVRPKDWVKASESPITKRDIDATIAGDPELEWGESDYMDMADDSGSISRYHVITWNGVPSFWWYREEIRCSSPDDKQIIKLIRIAHALNAYVVGDDGERYELRNNILGKEKLIRLRG
jgi:hypothetical protein